MKISGAEDPPQSRVLTGGVEKGRMVMDLYISTVGLHLCVRSGHCLGIAIPTSKSHCKSQGYHAY